MIIQGFFTGVAIFAGYMSSWVLARYVAKRKGWL